MDKTVRYRVYGVIDTDEGGAEEALEQMRQYGSACLLDVEIVKGKPQLPLADEDFEAHYRKKKED